MVSEQFFYEYIRSEHKFRPTLPIPFRGVNKFYDIYLEEIMDWILLFYADARANNDIYGGANANPDQFPYGDPDYLPHFNIYFSEELFNDIIPVNADVATIYIPEMDWYNPNPRELNITDIQDFESLIYSIEYPPRVSEVTDEETGVTTEVPREPCTGIAQSDIRFLRLYVYDIARELVNAINYIPPNILIRNTNTFPAVQPEVNVPRFIPSGRNLPVDVDIQAIRPYLGFILSQYDDVKKEVTQHLTYINLFDLANNKELNRYSYYGVYDIIDLDGIKFNYTKIFHDGYNHFIFIGLEEGDYATPGVLITNTAFLPLIKLKPITESFYKITEYLGIEDLRILSTDKTTIRRAYLPDADIPDESASYDTYTTYDLSRYIYNGGILDSLTSTETATDYIFNHLVMSSPVELAFDCTVTPPITISAGGFAGSYNDEGVNALWAITASPQMLVDEKMDIYCFKTVTRAESCGGNARNYGYDFALVGRILNREERGEEEEEESSEDLTDEERAAQEAEEQEQDNDVRPFKPKNKENFNPWEMAVIEDEARNPAYGTIHPDPRRIHLWGYGFEGPLGCYGTQELVYIACFAASEYNRRIATNFNQGRKDLLIIGDPYVSKAKWKSALNNWNKLQGASTTSDFPTTAFTDAEGERVEDTLLLETGFRLVFNGLVPLIENSPLEPMIWKIQTTGRAKNFAYLHDDVDENGEAVGDGHSKLLSIANFHDPVFITVTDAYREPTCPQDADKDYLDLNRRTRSLSVRVWPRTLPCIQHLETFKLDEPQEFFFNGFSKTIDSYPIFGIFPAFYVSGLRSNLEIKITDAGDSEDKTAYLDAFANGYFILDEFIENSGLPEGVDSGIKTSFDGSIAYDLPFSHRQNDVFSSIIVQNTNQWILYMWGKYYGVSTLTLRDYVDYHQEDYSPELHITPRPDLSALEIYLWTVEDIPTNVTILPGGDPQDFEIKVKGIVSHPMIWATTDSSVATIVEIEDSSGSGSTNNDVATTLIINEEGTSIDEQMDNNGPKARLTVHKAGTFRVVVMDSARIPFLSYEVKASAAEEDGGPSTAVIDP